MFSLLKTFLAVFLGLPGFFVLAWAFSRHPWMLLVAAVAIAAVWPAHQRWAKREAEHRQALDQLGKRR